MGPAPSPSDTCGTPGDHLELTGIHLIVHDWGGIIGLARALSHLELVASLTITNTAGFFPPCDKAIPLRLVRNLAPYDCPRHRLATLRFITAA